MAEVEIGDALDVVGKIPWRQTMQAILSDKIVLITSTRTPRTHMASAKSLLDRSRPILCINKCGLAKSAVCEYRQ